jgi:uncharacterized protein YkwD
MGHRIATAAPPRGRRIVGLSAVVLLAALCAILLAASSAATAHAELAPEAQASTLEVEVLSAINTDRVAAGLPELALAGELSRVASRHASQMADRTDLHHNPKLGDDVDRWYRVGENVGRSPSVDAVHTAFMASPSHAANILDAGFTEVGIAVDDRDGTLWVTQVFREPSALALLPF